MKNKIEHLFHDCGSIYVSTIEPKKNEPLTVRLRTKKGNVTWADIEYSTDGINWCAQKMHLEKEDATGYHEFFVGTIPGQEKMFKYRFHVGNESPENDVYYTRTKIGKIAPTFDEKSVKTDNCWGVIPGYHSPDWAKGVVYYSALPDAFYNGDITNDEPISGSNMSVPWNMLWHTLQYKYGGDLKGVEKKLDYIKALGCEAVFLDPIFRATQNAGYGPEFYDQIENSFGNRQALEELAKAIHDKEMYYMQDIVLMFTANDHVWFDKENLAPFPGAAQKWESEFHDFYRFNGEEGEVDKYVSHWGGATLNLANEKLKGLLYKNEDSYLKYYCDKPFEIDGLRFDCGGDLSGIHEDGSVADSLEVVGDIRKVLKEKHPELLFLSEYSMYYGMDSGVWDSRWNLQFVGYALKYMRGEVPESELFTCFDEEMHNLPRAIALCQYNSMSDHDRPRNHGVEPWAYRAYQLIHMTEIGSPCIYYGDEVKNLREFREWSSFYAMEWNEALWDYAVLYQTKALTELRKCYPVLRQGIIKYICADDERHILAFARMDEKETVITVASRNADECTLQIDVRELGEVDKTVFTDWFSGVHYVAENGFITVDLPMGGTIFVKGEASSSYKGGFETIGALRPEKVIVPKKNAIEIHGQNGFLSRDVFNTVTFAVNYVQNRGKGMICLRSKAGADADWIGVVLEGARAEVFVKEDGKITKVAEKEVDLQKRIVLSRNADNTFDVYAVKGHGTLGTPQGNEKRANVTMSCLRKLKGCEVIARGVVLELPNHIQATLQAMDGEACFENISVEYDKQPILCADFRKGPSAMFDVSDEKGRTVSQVLSYRKDGMYVCPENGRTLFLSNACNEDWTFKSKFAFEGTKEGDFAGVLCWQENDIYIAAGRMYLEGKQRLVFGRACAGKFVVYHMEEDKWSDKVITISLQRIGTAYTAVYSYDEIIWKMIGRDIIANLCVERAGIMVTGGTSAVFTYASYGDAIHDGISCNTPRTPIEIVTNFAPMEQTMIQPAYKVVSGAWHYAHEGYMQTSMETAQLGVSNKIYRDFKVDGTYVIEQGVGFIGFEFGKKAYDSAIGDGWVFKLYADRSVSLEKQGELLGNAFIPENIGKEIKLTVEYRHGVFIVFAGQNAVPILVLRDMEGVEGYITYCMEGVIGHINNYLTASYDAACYYAGQYEKPEFFDKGVKKNWLGTNAFISPFATAVTNFSAEVSYAVENWGEDGRVGLVFASPESKFVKGNALKISCGADGRIMLMNGQDAYAVANFKTQADAHTIKVIRDYGQILVFADEDEIPCIQYPDIAVNGGVVSLFADRAVVKFSEFKVVNR